jgi:amino acid adenylation domain-containing protein
VSAGHHVRSGKRCASRAATATGSALMSEREKKRQKVVVEGQEEAVKAPHVQTGDDAVEARVASVEELVQLDAWNSAGEMEYPDTSCLQDLFWATAKKYPNRVALIDGMTEKQWTYAELDMQTDKLASFLFNEHGVRPGGIVGILLNRSPEFVIAYIAILKAGGAYMPLELSYPNDLLDRAITEGEAISVLTTSEYAPRLAPSVNRLLMEGDWLDRLPVNLPEMPEGGFQPKPTIDDRAYMVMSSGTTGQPKGIMCPHRGSVFNYYHRAQTYPLESDHREGMGVFMTWECFRPFLSGGTAVTIHDTVLFNPEQLTSLIARMKLTRMLFTPSLLQLVLDSLPREVISERMKNMKLLWLCGEVVSVQMAQLFKDTCPNCKLLNLYSISECHDTNIADLGKIDTDIFPEYAPCGVSIPNTKCFILNSSTMARVGIGELGEVYIGGPTLALGYNKMLEKTAERFPPSPFPTCPGRLYRTGDLGRLLGPDGSLQIVGRCDFMVKVRGYSVVLGAVEVALAKHPQVASAVVLAEGDEAKSGEKRLIAYIVPTVWVKPPSAASVRAFLKTEIPIYALPSVFLVLNALPVSGEGAAKLNRKASRIR